MLMHTAPPDIDSSYAMGWIAPDPGAKPRPIEHSGVLSAFHADMALLPDDGYGIVLLYNYSYALANFNGIKQGLIDLLTGEQASSNGLSAGSLGLLLAVLAVLTAVLQLRGLLRLRQWTVKTKHATPWRLVLGLVWQFVPAVLLVGMQSLVALSAGRVFSYYQLFLSMPDLMLWLSLSAILGIATGWQGSSSWRGVWRDKRMGLGCRQISSRTRTTAPASSRDLLSELRSPLDLNG